MLFYKYFRLYTYNYIIGEDRHLLCKESVLLSIFEKSFIPCYNNIITEYTFCLEKSG